MKLRKRGGDRPQPDLHVLHSVEATPHHDRSAPARLCHARHLGKRGAIIGNEHDAENAEDGIEGAIVELETPGIHDAAFASRTAALEQPAVQAGDHARRGVYARDCRAAVGRQNGERARSGRNIKHALSRGDTHTIERGFGRTAGSKVRGPFHSPRRSHPSSVGRSGRSWGPPRALS